MNAKFMLNLTNKIMEDQLELEHALIEHDIQFIKQAKKAGCRIVGKPGVRLGSLHAELEIIIHKQAHTTSQQQFKSVLNYTKEIAKFFKSAQVEIDNYLTEMERTEITIKPSKKLSSQTSLILDSILGVVLRITPEGTLFLFIWPFTSRYETNSWIKSPEKRETLDLFIKESFMAMEILEKAIRLVEYI